MILNYGIKPGNGSNAVNPDYLVVMAPVHPLISQEQESAINGKNPRISLNNGWYDLREIYRDIAFEDHSLDKYGDHSPWHPVWQSVNVVEEDILFVEGQIDRLALRRHGIGRSIIVGPTWVPKVAFMYADDSGTGSGTCTDGRLHEICTALQQMLDPTNRTICGWPPVIIIGNDLINQSPLHELLISVCLNDNHNTNQVIHGYTGQRMGTLGRRQSFPHGRSEPEINPEITKIDITKPIVIVHPAGVL